MYVGVPDRIVTALQEEAVRAYPRECCGLLIGTRLPDGWRVHRHVAAANVAPGDRPDRFEIDPQTLIDVHRRLREAGDAEAVVGHYHSHPNGRATPSATDAAWIVDPGLVWLIVPVAASGAGQVRAWAPAGARFRPVDLRVGSV